MQCEGAQLAPTQLAVVIHRLLGQAHEQGCFNVTLYADGIRVAAVDDRGYAAALCGAEGPTMSKIK